MTELTKPGGKLAPALKDGLIDVDLANRLLAERADPVRELAAAMPTARPAATSDPAAAAASAGYVDARTRKMRADAEASELNLLALQKKLVSREGVENSAGEFGQLVLQALQDGMADLATRARQAATNADAQQLAGRLARELAGKLAGELRRRAREVAADG